MTETDTLDDLDLSGLDRNDVPAAALRLYTGMMHLKCTNPAWNKMLQVLLPCDMDKSTETSNPIVVRDLEPGQKLLVKDIQNKHTVVENVPRFAMQFAKMGFFLPDSLQQGKPLEEYLEQARAVAYRLIPEGILRKQCSVNANRFNIYALLYKDGSVFFTMSFKMQEPEYRQSTGGF